MSSWLARTPSSPSWSGLADDAEPGPEVKYAAARRGVTEGSSWLNGSRVAAAAPSPPAAAKLPSPRPPGGQPAKTTVNDWYVPTALPPPRAGPFKAIHRPEAGLAVGPRVTTRALLLAAVERDPLALLCLSDDLKGDREFVRTVVMHEGACLQHASDAMRDDRAVHFTSSAP
jgi:hypothetical protein